MTTHTQTGIVMLENPETEQIISFQESRIEFVVPENVAGFSTTSVGTDDGLPLLRLDVDSYATLIDGTDIATFTSADLQFLQISWDAGVHSAVIANLYDNATSNSYVFRLAGDAFPEAALASVATLQAFVQTIALAAPPAAFGPGQTIAFASLPDISSTENDLIPGTGSADTLSGGLGDDTINGAGGDDTIEGNDGDDVLNGGAGNDRLDGGAGAGDTAVFDVALADAMVEFVEDTVNVTNGGTVDALLNIEHLQFTDQTVTVSSLRPSVELTGTDGPDALDGGSGADVLSGRGGDDTLRGLNGDDRLLGEDGNDVLQGGDGADTLNGGAGNDQIIGGATDADLRDVVYGGDGDDSVDTGHGNDLVFGQGGNDTIAGGFGVDILQGQEGNDIITGSAYSDQVFGGDGDDFVNGGFGHDRINGGTGADKIFHVGGTADQMLGHGSDWVQDYNAEEGDVLLFGDATATADQFQVNKTHTENSEGERSGDDNVEEAFVIYRPTGQILWALVDGDGQANVNLQIGGDVFDLLA